MKKLLIIAASVAGMSFASSALAAGGESHIEDVSFAHEGPFGKYDEAQLQRGFQVYLEVCSGCHGLKFVSFRELGEAGGPNFPENMVKAVAKEYEVENEDGELVAASPSDKFPPNNDAGAPDLSLMAKARAGFHGPAGTGISQLVNGMGGPEYIYSLLTGYHDAPDCAPEDFDGYYNATFTAGGIPDECKDEDGHSLITGSYISMAPPLEEGLIEYAEGQPEATLEQMSEDIASFLMWTAEPDLNDRKGDGFKYLGFILFLTVLLYLVNKKIWAPIKRKD
jgi:ubiquinol-cytochrome c reductase cytochrome c1 subunit